MSHSDGGVTSHTPSEVIEMAQYHQTAITSEILGLLSNGLAIMYIYVYSICVKNMGPPNPAIHVTESEFIRPQMSQTHIKIYNVHSTLQGHIQITKTWGNLHYLFLNVTVSLFAVLLRFPQVIAV